MVPTRGREFFVGVCAVAETGTHTNSAAVAVAISVISLKLGGFMKLMTHGDKEVANCVWLRAGSKAGLRLRRHTRR